ncbi:AmmeMemoRadiSam system radical SAM enzyme [candidate division FCPU426 bacterium]|nr:AmmeMemoRadiSam system radical SAM enzyme [candidate division FCPU426 bacterium]
MKITVGCAFWPALVLATMLAVPGHLHGAPDAKEAEHYERLPADEIQCLLCPRACVIKPNDVGYCRVRRNVKGKLISLVYAKPCSLNIDPIEKKPLYHFLPGTPTLSLATVGCNLRCVFCQNWSISQAEPGTVRTQLLMPEQIVAQAQKEGCPSISFTYSEPTVFYEYMFDTAFLAKQHGIRNTAITCGYINPKPLKKLCQVIDATHVDLKGFSDKTYRLVAGAKFHPLLETLMIYKSQGVWLEVGYLVIPTVNDSREEIKAMCEWVATNLGPDVPVHFLRFFPQHKLTRLPPTPVKTLVQAAALAKTAGIRYVYLGNVPGHEYNSTFCHSCGKLLILRRGYFIEEFHLKDGCCEYCGQKIPGVWK